MPAATKRRKVIATPRNASSSFTKTRGLDIFTTVSKVRSTDKILAGEYVSAITTSQLGGRLTTLNKRKAVDIEEDLVSEDFTAAIEDRVLKPLLEGASQESLRTPQKPIELSTPFEASTKGTSGILNHLFIPSKTTTKPAAQELPEELLDLINLHAAFLTALSLHYAHNGTHAPADLRMLCPDVARAWGKRRVLLDDIRRTLGVMNAKLPKETRDQKTGTLSLSNYGHGKICVEMRTGSGKAGRIAKPVNENLLNDIYVRGLRTAWEQRDDAGMKAGDFIKGLPLETVRICSSFTKMSPLLAKGQRRLQDLKAGIIIKNESVIEKATNIKGAKLTLLERLRAKQLHQASLPPPPSMEQLARKAALQRIEEVAGVLTMLSTSSSIGQQRISFTLLTVLGKLRDSFKTPMSKEEGDTCLRLLAADIAPNWVKIVKMGKVEALVVNRDERPTELHIKESVRRALTVL